MMRRDKHESIFNTDTRHIILDIQFGKPKVSEVETEVDVDDDDDDVYT